MVNKMSSYDLCLIMCPPWDIQKPPINISYLTEFMRSKGYKVWTKDLNIELYNSVGERSVDLKTPEEYKYSRLADLWEVMSQNVISAERMTKILIREAGEEIDDWIEEILNTNARYIGFSIHYRNVFLTEAMAKRIKEKAPERIIIYGGPEVAAALRMNTLKDLSADVYVVGEGEISLWEFIEKHKSTGKFMPIDGVVYKLGDRITEYVPRQLIQDIDILPHPTYDYFRLSDYHPSPGYTCLPFLFSRGCIGKCTFCMDHYMAGKYRSRSPDNAIAEMKYHIKRYGIRKFHFNDLVCDGNPKALMKFCEEVVKSKLEIEWWSYALIHPKMNFEMFKKMYESGCRGLLFGLESASDKVLKLMNKYYDSETAERVIRDCAKSGIHTAINIIVGFPGETLEDFEDTLNFIKRNREYISSIGNLSTLVLSPGTLVTTRPDLFGVKIDKERKTWYDDVGNTLEERNRKLDECYTLLKKLGLEVAVVNRELAEGEPKSSGGEAAKAVALEHCAVVKSLRLLDASERECQKFEPKSQMIVELEFEVVNVIENPLFRVQIHGKNESNDDVFLFGMNTARFNIDFGRMNEGTGKIWLLIYSLNLLSGEYTLEAGIWPSESAEKPYSIAKTNFVVAGSHDKQFGLIEQPVQITMIKSDESYPAKSDCIRDATIVGLKKSRSRFLNTQKELIVETELEIEEPKYLYLSFQLFLDNGLIHQVDWVDPLPKGFSMWEIKYSPLNLLKGLYELKIELATRVANDPISTKRIPFEVRSKRADGGGLVFMPTAWVIKKLP